ncbi:hypothetical protein QL996_04350 [Planococcus sp. APC 4015]|nr:hypothetical protein [Planococcus sp. APC 4015]
MIDTWQVFTFRIRLKLAKTFSGIDFVGRQRLLPHRSGVSEEVRLETWSPDETLRDATLLLLIGDGYKTAQQALDASVAWRGQLQLMLAHANIGADFGERHDRQLTETGQTYWNEIPLDGAVNHADHGLVVYPTELGPTAWMHAEVSLSGAAMAPPDKVIDLISDHQLGLSTLGQVAFNLYSASFEASNADARLLMAMAALETLVPPESRPDMEVELIDRLAALLEEDGSLSREAKDALHAGLGNLRHKSISQRLRALWPRLDGQTFRGKTAARAFRNAYQIRNRLVHLPTSATSPHDVALAAFDLQNIVAALLASDIPTARAN